MFNRENTKYKGRGDRGFPGTTKVSKIIPGEPFWPIINREEVLEDLMKYSPGNNNTLGDIKLRQDAEHVVPFYDDLSKEVQEKFPRDNVQFQYDLLTQHVGIID